MKRMTASKAAGGEPASPEGAVPIDRFECVLGAGRGEPAARRQQWRYRELVDPDQSGHAATRQEQNRRHGSPGSKHGVAPGEDLCPERIEAGGVCLTTHLDDYVPRWLPCLDLLPPNLSQPAAQTIAGHRGRVKLGDDESHPWLARLVVHPDHVQMLEAAAPAMSEAAAKVGRAREPVSPREARRCRQEPPCFDGSDTVSRFRPFFRRRESTARPQRVAIRARNPCLVIRRLFRGRYDGFIRGILPSEPGKLVGREGWGQVEGRQGRESRERRERE